TADRTRLLRSPSTPARDPTAEALTRRRWRGPSVTATSMRRAPADVDPTPRSAFPRTRIPESSSNDHELEARAPRRHPTARLLPPFTVVDPCPCVAHRRLTGDATPTLSTGVRQKHP